MYNGTPQDKEIARLCFKQYICWQWRNFVIPIYASCFWPLRCRAI